MALAVSGVRCEIREVLLRDKPEEMLAISKKGTVPVLQLPDGQVMDESLDVMRWALNKSDPELWLNTENDLIPNIFSAFSLPLGSYHGDFII